MAAREAPRITVSIDRRMLARARRAGEEARGGNVSPSVILAEELLSPLRAQLEDMRGNPTEADYRGLAAVFHALSDCLWTASIGARAATLTPAPQARPRGRKAR